MLAGEERSSQYYSVFGIRELKPLIRITNASVECPIAGCVVDVERCRRGKKLSSPEFLCAQHKIYVSPSTFEYSHIDQNLLWHDPADRHALATLLRYKRESRLARDNSEDALSWNIFRHLEKTSQLERLLQSWTGKRVHHSEIIYWSYSARAGGVMPELRRTRSNFSERPKRSSEPDLIVSSRDALFWIEVKFTSTNNSTPSAPERCTTYGRHTWYNHVFSQSFETVAITNRRYELMRMWLLGTWAANEAEKPFYLVNLVRRQRREVQFQSCIKEDNARRFMAVTWEDDVYPFLSETAQRSDNAILIEYLRNKAGGYSNGRLVRGFDF